MSALSDGDRQLLELAGRGAGASEVLAVTGLQPVRYLQRLNRLLDTEAALAHDPQLVYRLRRITRR